LVLTCCIAGQRARTLIIIQRGKICQAFVLVRDVRYT
jgi:hypothetical protein